MKSLIALVLLVVAVLVGTLLYRLGAFKPVTITEGIRGPSKVVYKHHVGAYHKIVPVIEEVEKWAKANGEPCLFAFGEYYDDPDKVAEDRLRSNGGCIVLKEWKTGLPDAFKYREIPNHWFVIAQFDGAPSIGPMKVYPKVQDYLDEHHFSQTGPTYELYQVLPNAQVHTTYLFPVIKDGDRDPVSVGGPEYAP
jgi:hypothetical protein